MLWFKCDDNGQVIININNLIKTLQNTSIPEIQDKQQEILESVQNIVSGGSGSGITPEQLNEILTAIQDIPSEALLNNQTEIKEKIDANTTDIGTIKTTIEDIKNTSITELLGNQTTIASKLTVNGQKIDTINDLLNLIYGSMDASVEGTLTAGETTITFTDSAITDDTSIEVYTDTFNVAPESVEVSDGSITITFAEQETDLGVRVVFKRTIDWNKVTITNEIDASVNHD